MYKVAQFRLNAISYVGIAALFFSLIGCARDSATTAVPSSVVGDRGSSQVSVSAPAALGTNSSPRSSSADASDRVSAIYRNNPEVVDLQDVVLALAFSKAPENARGDRDIADAANQILPANAAVEVPFTNILTDSDYVPDRAIDSDFPLSLDLLDIAVIYAATVIPAEQRTEATLAEAVTALNLGVELRGGDIAAIPPELPPAPTSIDPGQTPGTARPLRVLPTLLEVSEDVGDSDPNDFYRFQLENSANIEIELANFAGQGEFQLMSDVNDNGEFDLGELLSGSRLSGIGRQSLRTKLDPGTYFVRVFPSGTASNNEVNYQLSFSTEVPTNVITPEPGNNISTSAILDDLNSDYIGFVSTLLDSDDFYRLDFNEITELELELDNLSGDGRLQVIRDFNNNELVDLGETIFNQNGFGTSRERIPTALDPGRYYVRVLPGDDDATLVGYLLSFQTSLPSKRLVGEPGDRFNEAILFDEFEVEYRGFIGAVADPADLYRLEVEQVTNVELDLDKDFLLSSSLQIVADLDDNGELDLGETLFSRQSSSSSTRFEVTLDPGVYFVRLSPGDEDVAGLGYTLTPSATLPTNRFARDPGNTLDDATVLPDLDGAEYRGFVGATADDRDVYQFTVTQRVSFDVRLDDLTDDTILRLLDGSNQNGAVIAETQGSLRASIQDAILEPGTYFLEVLPAQNDVFGASYTLTPNVSLP